MTDEQIVDAVEREFVFDSGVSADAIDVRTDAGIVELSGTVDNLLAKDRAVLIAETVKGVRSVVDRIEVQPAELRSDADLVRDVEKALVADPATEEYQVIVRADDSEVSLSGTVDSWRERRLAERVARGVRGVMEVNNRIAVAYRDERPDSEIQQDVEGALRWDPLVDDGLVEVAVKDGKVRLSGTVGSAAEKRRATTDSWTTGVHDVQADLMVARWARDEDLRASKYVHRSDEEIAEAVDAALVRDPRVFSFDVETAVSAGIVTLSGSVTNVKASRAAALDAANTLGVRSVENEIRVEPSEPFLDEDVAIQVRDALARDPYVDRYDIRVAVRDGTVFLAGMVDSYFEKGQADEASSRVEGVTSVVNNLVVGDSPHLSYDPYVDWWDVYGFGWYDPQAVSPTGGDSAIQTDIESELWWSPYVDADEVDVSVDNGIATLTGTVDSWREWYAARTNAYEGGATVVVNDLTVES